MKGNGALVFIGIIAFVAAALVPINESGTVLQNLGLGSTVGDSSASIDPNDCPETTPSWDPNSFNVEDGSALTEGTNIYRTVGSTAWQTFTQGTAVVVPVGSTVEYVFGISTTDTLDNAYGPYGKFVVGCQEDLTAWNTLTSPASSDMGLYADEVEGSLSATFYNADDNAAAQTFTAGQTHVVEFKWSAGNEEYFGNPYISSTSVPGGGDSSHRAAYPNMLCMDLNTTAFDEPVYVRVKGGDTLRRVGTPIRHGGATGKTSYCYEAPVITDEEMRFEVALNADDTTAPGVDDTAYLYGANFYMDTDTFQIYWGVEDNEGSAVGQDTYDSLTIDVT